MVGEKTSPIINVTIVTGPHGVGKTRYCREKQEILQELLVISYDSLLYAVKRSYNVDKTVEQAVSDVCYTLMWNLAITSKKDSVHIMIDGFPNQIDSYKWFFDAADSMSIIILDGNVSELHERNRYRKEVGLPHVESRYVKYFWDCLGFLNSKEFVSFYSEKNIPVLRQNVTTVIAAD